MSDIYNIKTTNKYEDIIHLQHPTSANHPQMPIEDRAAQFSPFAALTGHEDAIRETQRRMEERFRKMEPGNPIRTAPYSSYKFELTPVT